MGQVSQNECMTRLERLETVLDGISEGFIILDREGNLLDINAAGAGLGGGEKEEAGRIPVSRWAEVTELETLDGRKLQFNEWPVSRALRGESFTREELKLTRKDKPYSVVLNFNSNVLRDAGGNLSMVVLTFHDITARKTAEAKLKESEQEYRNLFELSGSANVQVDAGSRKFVKVNKKMCEMTGYSAEELLKMTFSDLTHPDDRGPDMEQFEKVKRGEVPIYNIEKRYIRKDGRIIWVNVVAAMVKDEQGRIKLNIGSIHEITEKVELAQRLQETQQEIVYSTDAARIGTWTWQIGPNRLVWNKVMKKLFDIPVEAEVTFDIFKNSIDPEDVEQFMNKLDKALEAGEHIEAEFRVLHLDGSVHWLLNKGTISRDSRGKAVSMRGISIEITDRKKAELELKGSEERLRLTTEGADIGLWYWDLEKNDLIWSERTKSMFGFMEDAKVTYSMFLNAVIQADRKRVDEAVKFSIKTGSDYDIDFRIVCPDGKIEWVHAKGRVYFDERGKALSMLGIATDITQRKRQQEELESLAKKFEARTKEYEAVIGFVSHDLRSPIVNVKGFSGEIKKDLEMLREELEKAKLEPRVEKNVKMILEESVPESMGYIETSANAMEVLLTSLVQVARAGLGGVSPESLDMNKMIEEIIANLEYKIKQAEARVMLEKLPVCTADRGQASRIFTNLIDNAVKYLDKSRPGVIRIWGKSAGEESIYCVEDNGQGIEEQNREKIFEMFHRLSHKVQGEGLGLAMVKRLVDRNNGRIWVESEPGKGSKFFVALPK